MCVEIRGYFLLACFVCFGTDWFVSNWVDVVVVEEFFVSSLPVAFEDALGDVDWLVESLDDGFECGVVEDGEMCASGMICVVESL